MESSAVPFSFQTCRTPFLRRAVLAAALFAAPCFAQDPGFVARPKRPAFPFDGTIVSIDRDAKNAGDIGMEAGVVVGGLVGLGVGRVVELFDPPEKDEFLPPRIAGALGGAVLGGFFGGELQKERFPRMGRHWRATVAPANGSAPVSVDLGLDRGSWETNQAVRVFRDIDTGTISLSPNHPVIRHCRAAATAVKTAIFVPGWCRNGGDSAQELALHAEAFPGARCEARPWEGDGVDFWGCRDEADAEGRRFGAALASLTEEERARLALVGHSLGARVVVRALAALAAEGKTVRTGALLGAALPEDDPDLAAAARGCAESLVVVSSRGDAMLKWLYGSGGEGLSQALGLNGWPAPVPTNVVQRFLPPSFTDGFVPNAPLMDFAAMRRLCLHYAPFYLRYLADLENPDGAAPPDDPDVVRQGWPNLALPTVDAEIWWVVEDRLEPGWKLERNIVFGQWRILDPDGWRAAWGDEAAMRRSFGELKARHAEKSHAESAEVAEDPAFLAIGIAKDNIGKTLGFRQPPPDGWPRTFKTEHLLFARVPVGASNLWVSVFETTNAQWENVMQSPSPSFFTNSVWKATRPVESVNADQIANDFLPVLDGKLDGWRFRLPTESEWNLFSQDLSSQVPDPSQERCNDGSLDTGYWDMDKSLWGILFEYNDAKKTRYYRNCPPSKSGPAAVGSYPPNRYGLHDLRGNVSEWCAPPDSFAPVRGGCWLYRPEHCLVETRAFIPKDMTHHAKCDMGFRLVMEKRQPLP